MKTGNAGTPEGCREISRGLASRASVTPGLRTANVRTPEGCEESSHPSGVRIKPLKIYRGLRASRLPPANLLAPLRGALAILLLLTAGCSSQEGALEVRIPRGAGGVGFLPLLMMEKFQLVEKHAKEAGMETLNVRWIELGGPAAMNDALLSGSVDFIAAGPPAFLVLWDKTGNTMPVRGVAAMTSLPMYLNTTAAHLKKLDDLTDQDKIAVTGIKVSIPSIVMQMYAKQHYGDAEAMRFDKYTVSMTHPDGVIALLSGSGSISAHFTSPPFHQRERKDPKVRTVMTTNDVLGSATFTMLSTTSKFREQNPKIYGAVLKALEESNAMIVADKKKAAETLFGSTVESGFSMEEILEVLNDPDIRFTTTPESVMKYAEFMAGIGSISNKPSSWKDLFFPEIHGAPGS
jgi:NitT/TauT family transport system substrate-binding protein